MVYDAGEPDGVFGAQTEAAVRGFQKISGAQFGLKVDGIDRKSNQRSINLSNENGCYKRQRQRAAVFDGKKEACSMKYG
ncbi:MAG: peptidoglycan-binding domain-containing protein [Christensenellales bacterium]